MGPDYRKLQHNPTPKISRFLFTQNQISSRIRVDADDFRPMIPVPEWRTKMNFNDALKKLNDNVGKPAQQGQPAQPPQAPLNGPVPGQEMTQQEADALREANEAATEQDAINKMRVEQLSASIFSRLIGNQTLLDTVMDIEGSNIQINQPLLNVYIQVCNVIASQAAVGHANGVWGIPCFHGSQGGQQGPQQSGPVPTSPPAGPPPGFVPPQQSPAQPAAQ